MVQQILKAVIPPMKQHQRQHQQKQKQKQQSKRGGGRSAAQQYQGMTLQDLLRFMLKSIEGIPAHRRLPLIAITVQVIAPASLTTAVVILLQQHLAAAAAGAGAGAGTGAAGSRKAAKRLKQAGGDGGAGGAGGSELDRRGFAHTLCEHFSAALQLDTLVRMVREAVKICDRCGNAPPSPALASASASASIDSKDEEGAEDFVLDLDYGQLSEGEARALSTALVNFVNTQLSSKTLHYQLLSMAGSSKVQHTYIKLSQAALQYVCRLNASKDSAAAAAAVAAAAAGGIDGSDGSDDDGSSSSSRAEGDVKFWAALDGSAYKVLDNVQQLLSVPGFVAVVGDLVTNISKHSTAQHGTARHATHHTQLSSHCFFPFWKKFLDLESTELASVILIQWWHKTCTSGWHSILFFVNHRKPSQLHHDDAHIRRKALLMLNDKVRSQSVSRTVGRSASRSVGRIVGW